jgi:cobalt/nickel transport system permease protein
VEGIAAFLLLAALIGTISKIPLLSLLKRLAPAAAITFFISIPVLLNLVVQGEPLFILFRFEGPLKVGPIVVPQEISITRQGLESALTLLLRVVASVSLVFLLTMTTPPNTLIKSLSSLAPGSLKWVVSISYRYIFFLVRKVEQFIMALKSRQIAAVGPSKGRHWVASRIGLLFSMSMELSSELAMAMKSRGYKEEFKDRSSEFGAGRLSFPDKAWLVFSFLFAGVMLWKSFA